MLEYVEYKWHLNGVPNFFLFHPLARLRRWSGKVHFMDVVKFFTGNVALVFAPWENYSQSDKKESTDADDVDKAE